MLIIFWPKILIIFLYVMFAMKFSSRTIFEKYLKPAVSLAEGQTSNKKSAERQSQAHFHLAHYADALFKSYEERLNSNEWQAAMRLRKHKVAIEDMHIYEESFSLNCANFYSADDGTRSPYSAAKRFNKGTLLHCSH